MSIISIASSLIYDVIEKVIPSIEVQNELKAKIKSAMEIAKAQAEQEIAGQVNQAVSTASQAVAIHDDEKGNVLSRSWRPILMYLFMLIIANNYILYPFLHSFISGFPLLPVPQQMWNLMYIGLGGYVGGKSLENITHTIFNNDRFFSALRNREGSLSQQQVDDLNVAISEAEKQ